MKTFLDQIENNINIDKEIIEVMPKKGIKKQKELEAKIDELKEKYIKIRNAVVKEIRVRYNQYMEIPANAELEKLQEKLDYLNKSEIICNEKSSFEKMQLDRLVYDINGYYKKNLESTNKDIYEVIQRFKKVGINLTASDFDISEYAQAYIEALLKECKTGGFNSPALKEKFDEIYWQCSDLIYHILVNIRYLYNKYENDISKYYESRIKNLKTKGISEDIRIQRAKQKENYEDLKLTDEINIINKFLDSTYSIVDFNQTAYDAVYTKLTSKLRKDFSKDEVKDVDENIKRLNKNLFEYQSFLEYKFLNDEVLKLKKEIESAKEKEEEIKEQDKKNKTKGKKKQISEYEEVKKSISDVSAQIYKINDELSNNKKGLFGKSKIITDKEKNTKILERDKKILELKELYTKFDKLSFRESINLNIDDTSKIYDVLKIASYNYGFLAKCLIKRNNEITDKEITELITKIRKFVDEFNFNVINNIGITDKKSIDIIIKDNFKLIGFNLVKDDFQESAMEDLIKQTQMVVMFNNIEKSKISLDDIKFILNAKEILSEYN